MNYENFKATVVTRLEESLPEGKHLEQRCISKLNRKDMDALIITDDSSDIFPTLYVDQLYNSYERGTTVDEILDSVLEMSEMHFDIQDLTNDYFEDFSNVSDKICCRLVNSRLNEELLKETPHVDFLDLSVVFYIQIDAESGFSQVVVPDTLMECWGITLSELIPIATANTRKLNPLRTLSMKEAMPFGLADNIDNCVTKATVVSSENGRNGSIYMLDPAVFEDLADKAGDDLFIIPSSIHEVFAIPKSSVDRESLDQTICEVNLTCLAPEEYLSDHAYVFDRALKKLTL